jgi:Na+-driven multidrug efflux pump
MIAQNIGAGQIERVRRSVHNTVALNFALALCCFAAARFFPVQLLRLFTDDQAVIGIGVQYMRTVAFNHLFVSLLITFNSLAIGAGNTVFPLCTTIMNGFVFRVPLAVFFETVLGMGLAGVFIGFGFANVGGAVAGFLYYKLGRWKFR